MFLFNIALFYPKLRSETMTKTKVLSMNMEAQSIRINKITGFPIIFSIDLNNISVFSLFVFILSIAVKLD